MLNEDFFNSVPYRSTDAPYMQGITRSPFIISKEFRDILLSCKFKEICEIYFPSGFQLHLNRAVTNTPNAPAFTRQIHRDIPYMHTPSKYPLSLSFLTFLSDYRAPQLRCWPNSHNEYFYKFGIQKPIDLAFSQGDTIFFDSNLLHCTLKTDKTVNYVLNMYSSPIIKPVVDYSSNYAKEEIHKTSYRLDEIDKALGYQYQTPRDDLEYLNVH